MSSFWQNFSNEMSIGCCEDGTNQRTLNGGHAVILLNKDGCHFTWI